MCTSNCNKEQKGEAELDVSVVCNQIKLGQCRSILLGRLVTPQPYYRIYRRRRSSPCRSRFHQTEEEIQLSPAGPLWCKQRGETHLYPTAVSMRHSTQCWMLNIQRASTLKGQTLVQEVLKFSCLSTQGSMGHICTGSFHWSSYLNN